MVFNWLKGKPKKESDKKQSTQNQLPEIAWIAAADNPWGVPLLDVRPITLGMVSTSGNPMAAANAVSFGGDDGTSFIGASPFVDRTTTANLRFRIDNTLVDGALFIPRAMEQKWAIYYHRGQILIIRSWLRQVNVVADVQINDAYAEITRVRGIFMAEDEEPTLTVRILEYLLCSHAQDAIWWPAPLPAGIEAEPQRAAMWCFSAFGNRAYFATPHPINLPPPEQPPLRTDSVLHMAVARGDTAKVNALLDSGISPNLVGRSEGSSPLHWALSREDTNMLRLLLERGANVDSAAEQGITPLMTAVQMRDARKVTFLLEQGANPNASDQLGFTSLHRAADQGLEEIARLLLERGALPNPSAQEGQTPRSIAESRGYKAIIKLLDNRS